MDKKDEFCYYSFLLSIILNISESCSCVLFNFNSILDSLLKHF